MGFAWVRAWSSNVRTKIAQIRTNSPRIRRVHRCENARSASLHSPGRRPTRPRRPERPTRTEIKIQDQNSNSVPLSRTRPQDTNTGRGGGGVCDKRRVRVCVHGARRCQHARVDREVARASTATARAPIRHEHGRGGHPPSQAQGKRRASGVLRRAWPHRPSSPLLSSLSSLSLLSPARGRAHHAPRAIAGHFSPSQPVAPPRRPMLLSRDSRHRLLHLLVSPSPFGPFGRISTSTCASVTALGRSTATARPSPPKPSPRPSSL